MKHLEEKAEEKPVIDLDTKMGHLGLGLFTGIITGIALTLSSHFVYNNYFQKPAVERIETKAEKIPNYKEIEEIIFRSKHDYDKRPIPNHKIDKCYSPYYNII